MTDQTLALDIRVLRKTYGRTTAVNDISLAVPAGSFFGLVGPNGAGKTTTITMAVGLQRPDAGSAHVFGIDVWRDAERAKALMGVLPDGFALPERLTGPELLGYLGAMRGLDAAAVDRRTDELLTILDLVGAGATLIGEYSAGMRKKIGLATALLHAPRLLILDEPLEAVDPVSAATIKTLLRRFVDGGGSVVISSHAMSLVEELCDRVAIVDKGEVAAVGPIDDVRQGRTLEETFVSLVGARPLPDGSLAWLS